MTLEWLWWLAFGITFMLPEFWKWCGCWGML